MSPVTRVVRPFGTCVCVDNLHLFLVIAETGSASISLSKARKLKYLAFLSEEPSAKWIITALKTITPGHQNLQQISLHVPSLPPNPDPTINRADPANVRHAHGETSYRQWLDLDHLLGQLWESHSLRPKVTYNKYRDGTGRCCVGGFLPEVTRREIADLVGR